MPTMIELLGAQNAQQTGQGAGAGIGDAAISGLKTGVGLAQAQQQMEADKVRTVAMKEDLTQKQAIGLGNKLRAAAFSSDAKIFESRLASAKLYADQANIPFDEQGYRDLYSNERTRLVLQNGIKDVVSGKIPPGEFLAVSANRDELFNWAEAGIGRAAESQNKFNQEKELAGIRAQTAEEMFQARQAEALAKEERARQEREGERIQDDVKKLSTDLAKDSLPEVVSSIGAIDKLTGGLYTEDAVKKLDRIAGNKGFIAAVKIPFTEIKPFESIAFKGDDLTLFQSVSGLRNQYLKLRSGGAVADKESDRFLEELGSGGIRTGKQLANGLQSLTRAMQSTVKNKEAGVRPEAVEKYKQRGGGVSSEALPAPKETPPPSGGTSAATNFLKKLPANADKAKAAAAFAKAAGRQLSADEAAIFGIQAVAGGR
jgi:hypothetical protein